MKYKMKKEIANAFYTKNISSSQIKNTLIKNEDVLSNSEKKSL